MTWFAALRRLQIRFCFGPARPRISAAFKPLQTYDSNIENSISLQTCEFAPSWPTQQQHLHLPWGGLLHIWAASRCFLRGERGQGGSCALRPQVVAIGNVSGCLWEDRSLIPGCCVTFLDHGPHTHDGKPKSLSVKLKHERGNKTNTGPDYLLNTGMPFVRHHEQTNGYFFSSSKGWVYTRKLGVYKKN